MKDSEPRASDKSRKEQDDKTASTSGGLFAGTEGLRQRLYVYGQSAVCIGVCGGIAFGLYMVFRRYATETDVPERVIKSHKRLRGYMVNAADGDTFRFYHVPASRWAFTRRPAERSRGVAKQTICVRVSAVDAPEMAHFGNPEQPLAREARDRLLALLRGRAVTVKPLARDQYGRIVATVTYRSWLGFRHNVAHEMLRAGLATLYTGGNAQYDGEEALLARLQDDARRAKVGVWGLKDFKTPAEYKREHRK
ncbi:putative endonuclease lcl3 [Coemansia sp. RSA 1939]|nr:putative endonuclease lcl3 [Coemansia sp. RSA 1939]KAJ2607569.1 putative endonuclease lcl3 [Coemansia sp. RSA 1804]KAJ2682421.1 putative endonuclease lcl3 [Coemansia sp. RSA 1285]